MAIRVLSPHLVNQIAAGEVVERPASVAKELIENAIDAGSTRIVVEIEEGGLELVQVSDDGAGIAEEELPLALAPHATSKISSTTDLESIATMGFRGEALASIASVSRLRIISRQGNVPSAALIESDGGKRSAVRPAAAPPGTTVSVRNLFFNTPARRKFLKTPRAEGDRIAEVVESLAMAHPRIAFTFRMDGRVVLDLPAGDDRRRRVTGVLGPRVAPDLFEISDETGAPALAIWGLVGHPRLARTGARQVRIFLNGRMITDRAVLHALREAYRGLIEPARTPVAALFLQIDPTQVDVNVHPAKSEVRFRHSGAVHTLVQRTVLRRLREADLVPAFDLARTGAASSMSPATLEPPAWARVGGAPWSDPQPSSAPGPAPSWRDGDGHGGRGGGGTPAGGRLIPATTSWEGFDLASARAAMAQPSLSADRAAPEHDTPLPTFRPVSDALQVHERYVVTQDDQGLVIIDQHALHERYMFERLKERIDRGNLESQRLLVPATLEVGAGAAEQLESLAPLLTRIGIDASPIGPRTVAIHAFPSLLFERGVEPASFLQALLDRADADDFPADLEAALAEVLDMMACKAAIKSGDRLTAHELAELLALRERIERSTNCPHGRPTSLRLTLADLDRQFGRSS